MEILFKQIFILVALSISFPERRSNGGKNTSGETSVFYLIRHAEKEFLNPKEADPELSLKGKERARKWAEFFKDIELDAIFSTRYKRTLSTASPSAKAKGLDVKFYHPREITKKEFLAFNKGKALLIVGHSNTIPAFVNFVLEEKRFKNLNEDQFDQLFIVRINAKGKIDVETGDYQS